MIKLWSDERITKEISIENLKINTTTASFSDIIKQYITTGEKYDILMLPYFSTYIEIITKIREKGFLGVIIIVVSKNEAIFQPESAIENQIFAINTQKLGKSETISILNFLIKNEMEKLEFYRKNSINEKEDIEKIYKTNTKNTKKLDNLDIFDKKNIPDADKIITILKENEQQLLMTLDPNSLENTKTKMKLSGQIIDNTQHGFITIGNIDPQLNLKKIIKQNDTISVSFNLGEIFLSLNATVIEVNKNTIVLLKPTSIFKNSRKTLRYKYKKDDNLSIFVKSKESSTLKVIPYDISENGLSFITKSIFENNSEISIYIELNDNNILTDGKILRIMNSDEYYKYGVELYPHDLDSNMISRFVTLGKLS